VLGAWGVVVVVVGAYQLAAHASSLPVPRDSTRLSRALLALGAAGSPSATARDAVVVHFLGADCGCSRDVVRSLARRRPIADTQEFVFVVGDAGEARALLEGRGYHIEQLDERDATRRFDVQAVPLLVVATPSDGVRYIGGYTARKRDGAILTTSIVAQVLADTTPNALPVLGCAVSRRLRQQLDPLGVR
jgi:hypothetical protein